MNGRVYDPALSRFMSADPGITLPEYLQSYNRYSYTYNNPLSYIDPTGYDAWGAETPRGGLTEAAPRYYSNNTSTSGSTQGVNSSSGFGVTAFSMPGPAQTSTNTGQLYGLEAKNDTNGKGDAIRDLRIAFDRAHERGDIPGMEAAYRGYLELSGGLLDAGSHMRLAAWGNTILRAQSDAGQALDSSVLKNTAAVSALMLATSTQPGAAKETTRVGRWMSQAEYDAMKASGKVQESLSGTTHVASPADASAFINQAKPGSVYVEFNVPTSSLKATNQGWSKVIGPNSLEGRLAERKGLPIPQMPAATDIAHSATKLP
jgi:hypothetical protein